MRQGWRSRCSDRSPLVTRNSTPAATSAATVTSLRDRFDRPGGDAVRAAFRASAGTLISNTALHGAKIAALYDVKPQARPGHHAVIGLSLPPEITARGQATRRYPRATSRSNCCSSGGTSTKGVRCALVRAVDPRCRTQMPGRSTDFRLTIVGVTRRTTLAGPAAGRADARCAASTASTKRRCTICWRRGACRRRAVALREFRDRVPGSDDVRPAGRRLRRRSERAAVHRRKRRRLARGDVQRRRPRHRCVQRLIGDPALAGDIAPRRAARASGDFTRETLSRADDRGLSHRDRIEGGEQRTPRPPVCPAPARHRLVDSRPGAHPLAVEAVLDRARQRQRTFGERQRPGARGRARRSGCRCGSVGTGCRDRAPTAPRRRGCGGQARASATRRDPRARDEPAERVEQRARRALVGIDLQHPAGLHCVLEAIALRGEIACEGVMGDLDPGNTRCKFGLLRLPCRRAGRRFGQTRCDSRSRSRRCRSRRRAAPMMPRPIACGTVVARDERAWAGR